MRRIILLLFVLFTPFMVRAYNVYLDGIYYDLDAESKTATVTFGTYMPSGPIGAIEIPASIEVKRHNFFCNGNWAKSIS